MRKRIIIFIVIFYNAIIVAAQTNWNVEAFRMMSNEQRCDHLLNQIPFSDLDSTSIATILNQANTILIEKNDIQSQLASRYIKFIERGHLKLTYSQKVELLLAMETQAKKSGFEVEAIVAHHYLVFEYYNAQKLAPELLYHEILNTYNKMQQLGFDNFKNYKIEAIMSHLSRFMLDLEDYEKSFQYLSVAEKYINATKKGDYYYTIILNQIETYYKQKKDYNKGIEYAQKLYDFHHAQEVTQTEKNWRNTYWQGLMSLDISEMLIEQGKLKESEQFALQGYQLCTIKETEDKEKVRAEYDATQVLISIKLKLGKIAEVNNLLQRSEILKKELEKSPNISYFKYLKLYRHYAKYYELTSDFANSVRYNNMAQVLQDSLDRRNDAHKYQKIQQRLEAEKYIEQIHLIEGEKQFQKWLRNAAILIMLLVAGLAYGNYRRIMFKRRLALEQLEEAKKELNIFTDGFREKSDLVENLRLEIERISRSGERSEYLEKLTHSTILTDYDWVQFRALFEKVHPEFINEQKALFPDLTAAETRLLVLEKLGLNTQEMANMLGVSRNTINQTKVRLRKKTGNS